MRLLGIIGKRERKKKKRAYLLVLARWHQYSVAGCRGCWVKLGRGMSAAAVRREAKVGVATIFVDASRDKDSRWSSSTLRAEVARLVVRRDCLCAAG